MTGGESVPSERAHRGKMLPVCIGQKRGPEVEAD